MSDAGALVIADAIRAVAGSIFLLALVSFLYVLGYLYRWRPRKPKWTHEQTHEDRW